MKASNQPSTSNSFDPAGIALIIDSCARNGVATLKFGDLEVWFSSKAGPPAPTLTLPAHLARQLGIEPVPQTNYPHTSTPGAEMPDHDQINKDTLERETEQMREDQLEDLKITDPLAYETIIRNEGLEDAGESSERSDDKPE